MSTPHHIHQALQAARKANIELRKADIDGSVANAADAMLDAIRAIADAVVWQDDLRSF